MIFFPISVLFMSMTIHSMAYMLLPNNYYVITAKYNYRLNIRNLILLKSKSESNKYDTEVKINKFLGNCRNKLRNDFSELVSNMNFLKLKESINSTSVGMLTAMNSLIKNLNDGKKGGEELNLVAMQFILISFQIFGIPSIFQFLVETASVFLYISGLYLFLSSLWEIRNYLSIFLTPGLNHNLVLTGGPYSIVRHPMYFGISLMSLSSSVLSKNVYKLVASLILIVVFCKSATQEENALKEKYLSEYENYAHDKYKIIPLLD